MKLTTRVVWDIETGRELARESREYAGAWALAKGNTQKNIATQNAQTGQQLANTLEGQSQSIQGQMLPFLQSETLNPTGFGAPALSEMKTQAGEAASGSAGTAAQRAKLLAGRTGNQAGQNAVIADANRTGGANLINADTSIDLANDQLKQQQQQEGVSGEGALESGDLSAALNSLGLSNSSLNTWADVNKSAGNLWSNAFLPMIQSGEQAAGMVFEGKG